MHYRRLGALLAGSVLVGTLLTLFVILQSGTVSAGLRQMLPASLQRDFLTVPRDAMDTLLRHQAGEIRRRVVDAWSTFRGGMAVALVLTMLVNRRHGGVTALVGSAILLVLCFVSGIFVIPDMHAAQKAIELRPPELTINEQHAFASARVVYRGLEMAITAVSAFVAGRLVFDLRRIFSTGR